MQSVNKQNPNILRTVYMPNDKIGQIKSETDKLNAQIQEDRAKFEKVILQLRHDKGSFEEMQREKYLKNRQELE